MFTMLWTPNSPLPMLTWENGVTAEHQTHYKINCKGSTDQSDTKERNSLYNDINTTVRCDQKVIIVQQDNYSRNKIKMALFVVNICVKFPV